MAKGIRAVEETLNLFTAALSQTFSAADTIALEAIEYTVSVNGGTGKLVLTGEATGECAVGNSLTFTPASAGNVVFTPTDGTSELCQLETGGYKTSWQIGDTPRTPSRLTLTTPDPPATFGRGASAKMLHASTVSTTRTLWRQGGYRLYIDTDNKAKFTNGVVTAETTALVWSADDRVHLYGGRKDGNLFVAAKVEAGAVVQDSTAGDSVDAGSLLYVGNRQVGLEFDGVDDVVDIGNPVELRLSGALTIEAWVSVNVFERGTIFGSGNEASAIGVRYSFHISGAGTDAYFNLGDGTTRIRIGRIELAGANVWHHLAGVWDGTTDANGAKFYRDGALAAQATISFSSIDSYQDWVVAGIAGNFLNGKVVDARAWNTARTQQQIQDNMHKRLTGTETGLVGYWPLDEAQGTGAGAAKDLTANANNGTINGAIWSAVDAANATLYNFVHNEGAEVDIDTYMAGVS